MHLAIVSPLPLEELKALAVQDFSRVPKFNLKEQVLPPTVSSANQRGHMIFIQPVRDMKQLSLNWKCRKNLPMTFR